MVGIFEIEKIDTLVDIGAYCLMLNHFHILLKERVEGGISLFMQKLLTKKRLEVGLIKRCFEDGE